MPGALARNPKQPARNPKQPARNPKQPAFGTRNHPKSGVGRSWQPTEGSGRLQGELPAARRRIREAPMEDLGTILTPESHQRPKFKPKMEPQMEPKIILNWKKTGAKARS